MENASDLQTDDALVIDCGKASAETRGFPSLLLYEFAMPPFDRQFA